MAIEEHRNMAITGEFDFQRQPKNIDVASVGGDDDTTLLWDDGDDTCTDASSLLEFDFHYQFNRNGSRQEVVQ